jgi:hypothetical protein
VQLEQSKAWWEEQAAQKAAVRAAQQEAEQAYAELTRFQVRSKILDNGTNNGCQNMAL